jgi:hypothetical protein
MLELGVAIVESGSVLAEPDRRGRSRGSVMDVNRGFVVLGRVARSLRSVARDKASAARERERPDPDRGPPGRRGYRRSGVAAREEPQQGLHPRHAADPGCHVAEPLPEARTGALEERANRGAAQ